MYRLYHADVGHSGTTAVTMVSAGLRDHALCRIPRMSDTSLKGGTAQSTLPESVCGEVESNWVGVNHMAVPNRALPPCTPSVQQSTVAGGELNRAASVKMKLWFCGRVMPLLGASAGLYMPFTCLARTSNLYSIPSLAICIRVVRRAGSLEAPC